MSTRADKALKAQKDKHHTILRELVQEVPNKTCAECLAKGPRWASWSLGVFVCIRCAGIHRNLGVHISKMKSIDLDSWKTEQLENVLKWGNKRAAEYYECYLPKDFVRPQTNHALEAFIRNKYEKKLYIMKDGEPEENSPSKVDRLKGGKKEEKEPEKKSTSASRQRRAERKKDVPTNPTTAATSDNTILNMASQKETNNLNVAQQNTKSHSMNDLLSLDSGASAATNDVKHASSSNDLLNFGSWSDPVATNAPAATNDPFQQANSSNDPFQSQNTNAQSSDPFQNNATPSSNSTAAPTQSTKESILSLYSSGNPQQQQQQHQQQQMYGVPGGVYMAQNMQGQRFYQQPGMQNNQMNMNQMNQLNSQMQQMAFKQQQQQPQQQQMMQNQMPGQMMQSNFYGQQQQQPVGIYNQQQQQQQPMMNMQMNNMQGNFNMPRQQQQQQPQQGFLGNNAASWGMMNQQQGMMGIMGQQQQQQRQQQSMMMTNGGIGNFNSSNTPMNGTSSGNTMSNQLWH